MTSKLIYLLIDFDIFHQLPKLGLVRGLFRALETSSMELFAKMVSKVNLKLLAVFTKGSNLDAWINLERAPANVTQFQKLTQRYTLTASKVQIILINYLHWNFRSVSCQQLTKIDIWCRSQEYLFEKCSANYY